MGSMVSAPPSLAPLPARVALVDDDGEFNEFLSEYLRARGAVVRSFRDGESFLKELEASSFDAYIVDLTLPGLDGVDVIAVLRGKDPHTSVLVVSGRVGPDAFNLHFARRRDRGPRGAIRGESWRHGISERALTSYAA